MMTRREGAPQWNVVVHGELAGATSATQLPDIPCGMVYLTATPSNAGNVYIGGDNTVTVDNGSTDITTGLLIAPGQTRVFFVPNLNVLWRICNNAGDDLTYFVHR